MKNEKIVLVGVIIISLVCILSGTYLLSTTAPTSKMQAGAFWLYGIAFWAVTYFLGTNISSKK